MSLSTHGGLVPRPCGCWSSLDTWWALHTTHAVFKAPSIQCKCRVAAQYCSGNKDKNKTVHIQYRDFKTCHQELGESTDVEPSHKSLLSLFLHTLINVNMLQWHGTSTNTELKIHSAVPNCILVRNKRNYLAPSTRAYHNLSYWIVNLCPLCSQL